MSPATKTRLLATAALFGSGAAALVYQVLWMRSFGLIFGNTTRATSVVLAVFMGGLALGGHLSKKLNFKNALKTYAALELLMGGTALWGGFALTRLPAVYALWPLGEWGELSLKMLAVAAITLPTATAAGMTLPVMVECLSRRGLNASRGFAGLYSVNTLGAAIGALSSAFLLIPTLGTSKTYAIAISVNLLLGLVALKFSAGVEKLALTPASAQAQAAQKRVPWLAFGSGLGAFLLEVVWVRSLILVIGSSSYAFSVMLSSILLGIALGAWLFQILQPKIQHTRAWLAWTCLFLSVMILVSFGLMGSLPDIYMKAIERLGHSFQTFQIVGFLMSFITLLLVTLPQGFLFPMLLSLYGKNESLGQSQVGSVYFWNTLGALAGSLGAGLLLIPLAGFRVVYLLASFCSAIMGLWLLAGLLSSAGKKALMAGLVLAASLLIFKFYDPWRRQTMSLGIYENGFKFLGKKSPEETLLNYFSRSGNSLAYYAEGKESVVTVTRLADGSMVLANNGKNDASDGGDIGTQKLVAHIPFACFPDARHIYVIGWGSGSTAGSASLHLVSDIDCVEIEPKVFDAASLFSDVNFEVWKDPRFKIRFNDARNDLLASPKRYDLILSEPPNPWIAGVSNLFTDEFYELAKSRLADHGVFGQWLPYYGMSLQDIQLQLRTFCHAFPQTQLWILADSRKNFFLSGDLMLIGSAQDIRPDYARIQKLFENKALAEDFAKIGIFEPWMLMSLQLLNRDEMLAFAGEGPLNTDGFPRIEFSAPRSHFRSGAENADSNQKIFSSLSSHKMGLYPGLLNTPFSRASLTKRERIQALGKLAAGYSDHSLFDQSLKILDEINSLGAPDAMATYYRGVGLFFSGKDIAGGITELEKALKSNLKEQKFYNTLCLAYLKLKKFDDAFRVFSQASKKWPEEIAFSYGQGVARYYGGNYPEARALFEKVLIMNPDHRGAKSLLASMPQGR